MALAFELDDLLFEHFELVEGLIEEKPDVLGTQSVSFRHFVTDPYRK